MSARLEYQPALDGLRAIAVLAVLFFHDEPARRVDGGFLGVDVFFVLSGFLITTILLIDDSQTGSTISAEFWYRRIRRLLPAFLLFMLIVSLDAFVKDEPSTHESIRKQGMWVLGYLANWQHIFAPDYAPSHFGHMWSLAIEEQWYVIWPFLLALLLAVTRRRYALVAAASLLLVLASAALMALYYDPAHQQRSFFSTEARAWELIAGALLAFAFWQREALSTGAQRVLDITGTVGAVYLFWAFFNIRIERIDLFPGQRLLVVGATMLVIAAAIQPQGRIVRGTLAWRPLVLIGLVSYGVYLYHVPIYTWLSPRNLGITGAPVMLLRLAVVLAFAALSYRFMEMPIRRGALQRLGVNGFVALAAAYSVVIGAFILSTPLIGGSFAPKEVAALSAYRHMAKTTPRGVQRVLVADDTSVFQLSRLSAADRRGRHSRGDGGDLRVRNRR